MDRNEQNTDYVATTIIFSTKLRQALMVDVPRIPKELDDFLRPAERWPDLNISHNWGDVIPYNNCIVLRVFGTQFTPHILPREVPLRIGFLQVMW